MASVTADQLSPQRRAEARMGRGGDSHQGSRCRLYPWAFQRHPANSHLNIELGKMLSGCAEAQERLAGYLTGVERLP